MSLFVRIGEIGVDADADGDFHILCGGQCVDTAYFIQAVGDEDTLAQRFFQTIIALARGRVIDVVGWYATVTCSIHFSQTGSIGIDVTGEYGL